jgi:uncharacterized protein
MLQFLSEKIGDTRERTSQGYLVLRDVPIARTGTMLYAGGEIPVTAGKDGIIRIERDASVVFHPDTIKSFQGVPVTIEHPDDDVDPSNWKQLTVGVVLDVRRGAGVHDNLLLADLLITDKQAIEGIESDKYRDVSAGYDAGYEEDEPGRGHQTGIAGNHLALLSGAGRCGPVCSIGDKATVEDRMNKFIDRIRAAFKSRDEQALEGVLKEAKDEEAVRPEEKKDDKKPEGEAQDDAEPTLADLLARLEAIEAKLNGKSADDQPKPQDKKEDKAAESTSDDEGDDDEEDEDEDDGAAAQAADAKSRDAAALRVEIQDVISRAEILAPGLKLPTVDAAADPQKVRDSLCVFRRRAMAQAIRTEKGRDALKPFVGESPNFKSMTCDAMKSAFIGASEVLKRTNNALPISVKDANAKAKDTASLVASINQRNAEFWARK